MDKSPEIYVGLITVAGTLHHISQGSLMQAILSLHKDAFERQISVQDGLLCTPTRMIDTLTGMDWIAHQSSRGLLVPSSGRGCVHFSAPINDMDTPMTRCLYAGLIKSFHPFDCI